MRKSNRITLPKTIEQVDPNTLVLPDDLIHRDDAMHVEKIAGSIEQLDFVDPPLIGPNSEVIDGVQRVKAAIRAGCSTIPIVRLNDATAHQVKAIRVALNKTQKGARWNEPVLKSTIDELIGQGFNIRNLGWDAPEIDQMFASPTTDADDTPAELLRQDPVISRPGDLFEIGEHDIACGSFRDASLAAQLMNGEQAAAVVMDPPYNERVADISGLGKNKHPEFAMASGEMSPEQFQGFLQEVVSTANTHLKPGGYQYAFMNWRNMHLLTQAALANGLEHVNTCVWVKSNAGMGSFYRSQHEMVGVFRKPGAKSTNNIKLGKFGRNRSNVWDCRGANAFGQSRDEALKDHPTVKPIVLLEGAIKDSTNRGEIILDLFGGSGSTMLAAERCGRKARLIEIEPRYVDVSLRRMREAFGAEAIHVETGLTFDELREQRLAEADA